MNPGQLYGLGAGLGAFSKNFISTDLALKQLALKQAAEERQRQLAEERQRMWEEQQRTAEMQRQMEEDAKQKARNARMKFLSEVVYPGVKNIPGFDELDTKDMTRFADDPEAFNAILNVWRAIQNAKNKVPQVKQSPRNLASLIMTEQKLHSLIGHGKSIKASDGNRYIVYDKVAVAAARRWKKLRPDWDIPEIYTLDEIEEAIKKKTATPPPAIKVRGLYKPRKLAVNPEVQQWYLQNKDKMDVAQKWQKIAEQQGWDTSWETIKPLLDRWYLQKTKTPQKGKIINKAQKEAEAAGF